MVSYDRPWWAGISFTLSILEVNTGLICACVITTSPLLTGKAARRKKASTRGDTNPSTGWSDVTTSARTRNASVPYMTAPRVEKGGDDNSSSEEALFKSDTPPPAMGYNAAPRAVNQQFAVLDYNDMPRFTTEGDEDYNGNNQHRLATESPATATTRKTSAPYSIAEGLAFTVPQVVHHQVPASQPAVHVRPPNVGAQSSTAVPGYEPSVVPMSQSDRTLFTPSPISSQAKSGQYARKYSTQRQQQAMANAPVTCPEQPYQRPYSPRRVSLNVKTVGKMPQYQRGSIYAPSVATPDEGPSPIHPFSPDAVWGGAQAQVPQQAVQPTYQVQQASGFATQHQPQQSIPQTGTVAPMFAQYEQRTALAPSWTNTAVHQTTSNYPATSPYSATAPTGPTFPVSAISPGGNTFQMQIPTAQKAQQIQLNPRRASQTLEQRREARRQASLSQAPQPPQQPRQARTRRAAAVDEDFAPCDLSGLQALAGRDYPRY